MKEIALILLSISTSLFLLIWNLKLTAQNYNLKRELLLREKWHLRELAKWRQRL